MPNYSKVQFIAWEIYTGPIYDDSNHAVSYPGISRAQGDRRWDVLSQCLDISARVQFTRLAVETAYKNASQEEDTLKVFVAPEFLYRGAAGAYLFDLLNGWRGTAAADLGMLPAPYDRDWGGLFGELRALAANEKFKDWVFVFGTAVGAAFQYANGMTIVNPDRSAECPVSGWNLSLIQCGGDTAEQRGACYFTQKHLKSGIDFIGFNVSHPGPHVFTDENTDHTTAPDKIILDRLIMENPLPCEAGGSRFRFPHICNSDGEMIQFGLEICLDHMQTEPPDGSGTGVTGRLAINGEAVNIQLVPSCGMTLHESSMALAPHDGPQIYSYAFNCDGLGGHVQLWCGSAAGPGHCPQHLADIMDSFSASGHIPVGGSIGLPGIFLPEAASKALQIDLQHIYAHQLWRSHEAFPIGGNSNQVFWPQGAGFVRALDPRPLCPPNTPEESTPEIPDNKLLELIKGNLDAFRKHYTLSTVKVTGKHVSKKGRGVSVDFGVELRATLNYATACQLPHVQGIIKLLGINAPELKAKDLACALRTEAVRSALARSVQPCILEFKGQQADPDLDASLTAGAVDIVVENIKSLVNELDSLYIGRTSTINLSFRAAFSGGGAPPSVMAVAYDGSAYDAGLLAPETDSKMHSNGQMQLQEIISSAVKIVLNRLESDSTPPEALEVYHRVRARDYANTWTSNPVQGTKDLTKWNTKDNPRVQRPPYAANPDGDCANYVSQAIYAGGIPMTSREKSDACHWFADPYGCSLAWENCTALHTYFTAKQYWVHSDFNQCSAGGIIFFKDKSGRRCHVVMCVQNDTVTRAYSAHTHDRRCQVYTVPDSFGVDSSAVEYWVFQNSTAD